MELGVWIKDDKGTEYVLRGSQIILLTPGTRLEDLKEVVLRLYQGLTGHYGPVDRRRAPDPQVADLYDAAKKRLQEQGP